MRAASHLRMENEKCGGIPWVQTEQTQSIAFLRRSPARLQCAVELIQIRLNWIGRGGIAST